MAVFLSKLVRFIDKVEVMNVFCDDMSPVMNFTALQRIDDEHISRSKIIPKFRKELTCKVQNGEGFIFSDQVPVSLYPAKCWKAPQSFLKTLLTGRSFSF